MMTLLAFALALIGFTALALAMERHHKQVLLCAPSVWQRWLLRGVGLFGLAVSFAACVANAGWGVGWVVWFGLLSAAALAVALILTYLPPRMPKRPCQRLPR